MYVVTTISYGQTTVFCDYAIDFSDTESQMIFLSAESWWKIERMQEVVASKIVMNVIEFIWADDMSWDTVL